MGKSISSLDELMVDVFELMDRDFGLMEAITEY